MVDIAHRKQQEKKIAKKRKNEQPELLKKRRGRPRKVLITSEELPTIGHNEEVELELIGDDEFCCLINKDPSCRNCNEDQMCAGRSTLYISSSASWSVDSRKFRKSWNIKIVDSLLEREVQNRISKISSVKTCYGGCLAVMLWRENYWWHWQIHVQFVYRSMFWSRKSVNTVAS